MDGLDIDETLKSGYEEKKHTKDKQPSWICLAFDSTKEERQYKGGRWKNAMHVVSMIQQKKMTNSTNHFLFIWSFKNAN